MVLKVFGGGRVAVPAMGFMEGSALNPEFARCRNLGGSGR